MENTESKINETDVTVSEESENKSMFVNKENMSTESADRSDSGIQTDVMVAVSYTHLDVYKRQPYEQFHTEERTTFFL